MSPLEELARKHGLHLPTLQELDEHLLNALEIEQKIKDDLPTLIFRPEEHWKQTGETGGMRATREVRRGSKNLAVVKWDVPPTSSHGAYTYEHGNTTLNDLRALVDRSLNEAPRSLSRLLHANAVPHNGTDIVYLVEEYYSGESLRAATEGKALDHKTFIKTFGDIFKGVHYHVSVEGIYHRDPNSGNIQLTKDGPVIHDWANARSIDEMQGRVEPTSGKRVTADPLLFRRFTGADKEYDLGSELWAWGINMLRAATGTDPYTLDQHEGTWRAGDKNFLHPDGTINKNAWHEYRDELLRNADKKIQGLIYIVRRLTSLDTIDRYEDTGELLKNWEEATTKRPWYKTWLGRTAIIAGTLGSTAAAGLATQKTLEVIALESQIEVVETSTEISAGWIQNLEIDSGIATNIRLEVGFNEFYELEDYPYVKLNVMNVTPGEKLFWKLQGSEIERPKDEYFSYLDAIPEQVTVDGLSIDDGWWKPYHVSRPSTSSDMGRMYEPSRGEAFIPAWAPEGTYNVSFDIFPRGEDQLPRNSNHPKLRYVDDEGAMIRRIVHVVAGDVPPEEQVFLHDANFNMLESLVEFRPTGDYRLASDITYEVWIPELDYRAEVPRFRNYGVQHLIDLRLPTVPQRYEGIEPPILRELTDVQKGGLASNWGYKMITSQKDSIAALPTEIRATLQMIAKRGDKILHVAHLPIRQVTELFPAGERTWWQVAPPTREYNANTVKYGMMTRTGSAQDSSE